MPDQPRILLILDVDETLVHATEAMRRKADFRVGPYNVYRRPYLEEFLKTCSAFYNLAIWSSGGSEYVHAIVANIMPPTVEPVFVWCRDRCTPRMNHETWENEFLKDLKKVKRLGFDLDRVLIVEDTPAKVLRNYGNAIYVNSFFGQADDEELLVLSRYLASIHFVVNVRRVEKRGWRQQARPEL